MAISSAWTQSPQVDRPREVLAAQLGQVPPGGDADLRRQVLDQHRHQVGREDHPQQQVAVLGAAGDVGGEVARVDVGDRGDERRAEQRQRRRAGARAPAAARSALGSAGGARPSSAASSGRRRRTAARLIAPPPPAWRRVSAPPSTWSSSPKRDERAGRRTARVHAPRSRRRARCRARPGSAASPDRSRRRARRRRARRARARPAARVGALVDLEVRGRDRVAVRVVGRVAELRRDQLRELRGDGVLEHLGLLVDAVPRHAERLGQVELEQAVVADHLERHALAAPA